MRFNPTEHQEEVELKVKSTHGVKVTVIFTKESKRPQEQHNNVTEVHWLYRKSKEVFIESSIHYCGCSIKLDIVDCLMIENQTDLDAHPSYTW